MLFLVVVSGCVMVRLCLLSLLNDLFGLCCFFPVCVLFVFVVVCWFLLFFVVCLFLLLLLLSLLIFCCYVCRCCLRDCLTPEAPQLGLCSLSAAGVGIIRVLSVRLVQIPLT